MKYKLNLVIGILNGLGVLLMIYEIFINGHIKDLFAWFVLIINLIASIWNISFFSKHKKDNNLI